MSIVHCWVGSESTRKSADDHAHTVVTFGMFKRPAPYDQTPVPLCASCARMFLDMQIGWQQVEEAKR